MKRCPACQRNYTDKRLKFCRFDGATLAAQVLHVDFKGDADGWPMVGFIIMVDDFRIENGATRFVPGSHLWSQSPDDLLKDSITNYEGQISACGPAGSIVIYNGPVWHGHGANLTSQPRRSLQGAYIRREAQGSVNQATRIRQDTMSRIGDLAKYLLELEPAVRHLYVSKQI